MPPAIGQVAPNGANGVNNFISGTPVSLIGEASYGTAGNMTQSGSQATNGADSAAVNSKKISITSVEVAGGIGFPGQIGGSNTYPVPGSGGSGGASVLGGVSIGGLGGVWNFQGTGSVAGGRAWGASDNTVDISNSGFDGAPGGRGADGPSVAGLGGHGGASAWGGLSVGGAGGSGTSDSDRDHSIANGGSSGDTSKNRVTISRSRFNGGQGGDGGNNDRPVYYGSGGSGGHGGASIWGGMTQGGTGGYETFNIMSPGNVSTLDGGNSGAASFNEVIIRGSTFLGAKGGNGGYSSQGHGAPGGHGGASVYGGVSIGGAGGHTHLLGEQNANGGSSGAVSANKVNITDSSFTGAGGGAGGDSTSLPGGSGGHGGASVWGGVSVGGAGGSGGSSNGGRAGDASNNLVVISNSSFTGAAGGQGGNSTVGAGGIGGNGGASVVGGMSVGGAGGAGMWVANGGAGGDASNNTVVLSNVTLAGGANGAGGAGNTASSVDGLIGGSVIGGVSYGGQGGEWARGSTNGGNAGNASFNKIHISGVSLISGDIYGGYSRGGEKGLGVEAKDGAGGLASNNTITLVGDDITIGGSIYGGLSKNGLVGGVSNVDPEYTSFYQGNTLKIQSGRIEVKGIHNVQNYHWLLPKNEFDGDVIVSINDPGNPLYQVDVKNTLHKVDVEAEGNTLHAGDKVVLIDRVKGSPIGLADSSIEQGFFIVYDAELQVEEVNNKDALVLRVLGTKDAVPDGKINPESEAFLKGRVAQLAMVDQGADMISDGVWSARASLREKNANLFVIADGGGNRYKAGNNSHIKLSDLKFAFGAAKAFRFQEGSVGMVGVFAEHGRGSYDSYSDLGGSREIHGDGKVRYNGVGALFHIDVAGADTLAVQNKPNIFDSKYGLYLHGAVRLGTAKVDFYSADLVNGNGVAGQYQMKSRYLTAMAGVGYVLTLDKKSAVDFYGRYSFSRLNEKNVQVLNEEMSVGVAHSHRLRLGARYGYSYSETVTPYAGLAVERNFNGDVSGSAYGFEIKEKSLKGNSLILETGLLIRSLGVNDPLAVRVGVQGYLGQRRGVAAELSARYVF